MTPTIEYSYRQNQESKLAGFQFQEKYCFQLDLKFHELESKEVNDMQCCHSEDFLMRSSLPLSSPKDWTLVQSDKDVNMEEHGEEFLPKLVVFDLGECVTGQSIDEFA